MSVTSEAEEIQRIAYELWQIDGEPFGREHEHWERARRIFESRMAASADVGNGRQADGPEEAPRPLGAGFEDAEPDRVPKMSGGPAPDLPGRPDQRA